MTDPGAVGATRAVWPQQQTLTPIPDPTALTDAAISRATTQFRRDLDGIRELLTERIETEAAARDQAIGALRDLGERRINDLDRATDRRINLIGLLPEQIRADRDRDLAALRADLTTRLNAMDKATELLAATLNGILDEKIAGLRTLSDERLTSINKATELRFAVAEQIPAQIEAAVEELRRLMDERFRAVALQFSERDTRFAQAGDAGERALAAALTSARELVQAQAQASEAAAVKSETSVTKQIDQIGASISSLERILTARITELKERIDRGEGSASGVQSVTGSPYESATAKSVASRAAMALIVSGASVLVAVISIVILLTKG